MTPEFLQIAKIVATLIPAATRVFLLGDKRGKREKAPVYGCRQCTGKSTVCILFLLSEMFECLKFEVSFIRLVLISQVGIVGSVNTEL